MKLHTSLGPNPAVVTMFMKEKGIELPLVQVDIRGGENRKETYLKLNPAGQSPALELDDGTVISEITAICEYLDDVNKGTPSLIGNTPQERAVTHMWVRRIDLGILEPMMAGFRYAEGLKMFESRMRCLPEAAAGMKAITQDKLAWLDGLMSGKTWIVGDRFTLADIMLYVFVNFFARVGQPINAELKNIVAWNERVKARPSAA
jgi:glutathione S-transferase